MGALQQLNYNLFYTQQTYKLGKIIKQHTKILEYNNITAPRVELNVHYMNMNYIGYLNTRRSGPTAFGEMSRGISRADEGFSDLVVL